MVLLHHEVEIEYPDSQKTEKHRATLLEFGKTVNGNTTTAMALTVGIPAAVGALVLSIPFYSCAVFQAKAVSELYFLFCSSYWQTKFRQEEFWGQ